MPQHHLNLTIILFSVINRTFIGESYPSADVQSVYSTAATDSANKFRRSTSKHLAVYRGQINKLMTFLNGIYTCFTFWYTILNLLCHWFSIQYREWLVKRPNTFCYEQCMQWKTILIIYYFIDSSPTEQEICPVG